MTNSIRLAGWALAAVAASWFSARAVGEPPRTGRVVILESAQILEGEIEQVGNQFRVRHTVGETWVPADRVQRLCADMADAYAFLRGQANLGDPDEHLRLARWCRGHGLHEQAVAEVTQALELRPSHTESQRLLESLRRDGETPPVTRSSAPAPEPTLPAAVEYNTDALGMFVTRVQPILMNACANCHATGRGGASFKLTRAYSNELTNRRATQQNLAAVLAQVNRKQPEASVLLARAVTVHGEASQPPLKGRQVPAFRALEEWIQLALAHEPKEPAPAVPLTTETPGGRGPAAASFATLSNQVPAAPKSADGPCPPAPQSDPFDPMLFNRPTQPAEAPDPRKPAGH